MVFAPEHQTQVFQTALKRIDANQKITAKLLEEVIEDLAIAPKGHRQRPKRPLNTEKTKATSDADSNALHKQHQDALQQLEFAINAVSMGKTTRYVLNLLQAVRRILSNDMPNIDTESPEATKTSKTARSNES